MTRKRSKESFERCNQCGTKVMRSDPYYATPCGTFCDFCMERYHARECRLCSKEFNLNGGWEGTA